MATPNSRLNAALPSLLSRLRRVGIPQREALSCVAASLFTTACLAAVALGSEVVNRFSANALRAYQETLRRHEAAPSNPALGWQFARACFDWAEFATNAAERASLAERGIEVSRSVVARDPKLAPAAYYLAMNLGQLARTKTLGALKLVNEMEAQFLLVRELDERFDYAGADRCLGLLYRDAPGWPVSIGSRSKSRRHLRRAIAISPDYPDNRLNWIEALLVWGDREEAREAAAGAVDALARARLNLKGADWEASWADWDVRWREILKATRVRLPITPPHP